MLPTLNEADNLPLLVAEIRRHLPETKLLIVDDNSSDGTGQVAESLCAQDPLHLQVLHRSQRQGLGMAYRAAFQKIIDENSAEAIVQMDADHSHPPSLLPLLLSQLANHDFVLASRYVPGGGITQWNWLRRRLSLLGNRYAQWCLGKQIQDWTGGFKVYRKEVLQTLLHYPSYGQGYLFQIETSFLAWKQGFRYCEVPFTFSERHQGRSKMNFSICWEAFYKTPQLPKRYQLMNREIKCPQRDPSKF